MINIFLPKNNDLETYSENSLLDWLTSYGVSHTADRSKPGYMLFELKHIFETGKIVDQLTNQELKRIQNGEIKIILFYAREPVTHHMLLNGFDNLNKHGIKNSSVILITGNFKIIKDHLFPKGLTVIPFFLFDLQTARQNYTGRDYISTMPERKFLCFNGVVKVHRTLLYLLLPREQGFISYLKRKYYSDDVLEGMVNDCANIPDDLKAKAIEEIHSPAHTIDLTQSEYIYDQFNDDFSLYDKTAFSIVSESIVDDWAIFITEKTFKAVLSMHPFVLVSSPGSYDLLKSFGYKTYDFLFTEYINIDRETNVYTKIKLVRQLVDNFDIKHYRINFDRVKAVAEFNRNHCLTQDYKSRLEDLVSNILNS